MIKRKHWLVLCNAQSLIYKLDELRTLASVTKPLFICVTEAWFMPEIHSDQVQIKGYSLYRNDRQDDPSDCSRGGGTSIYVSHLVKSTIVIFPPHCVKPSCIECTAIQFSDNESKSAPLFCVYNQTVCNLRPNSMYACI